tara:strand:+ start:345 stop:476 length:132 start_codon:yes stop_codon:yes gene_type:complete
MENQTVEEIILSCNPNHAAVVNFEPEPTPPITWAVCDLRFLDK